MSSHHPDGRSESDTQPSLIYNFSQVGFSVKYYMDQSSAQLKVLTAQLTYLRTRYGELTGLDGARETKTRPDTSQPGQCFPRKQAGQDIQ